MRLLSIFAIASAVVILCATKPATAAPSGTYHASCRDMQMQGNILKAMCRNGDGEYRWTFFNVSACPNGPIGNSRGTLFCEEPKEAGLPGGSWQLSCRNGTITGTTLDAQCSYGGLWRDASYDLRSCPGRALGNDHGSLTCEGGDTATLVLPPGSWRNSCINGRMSGWVVMADCRVGTGYRGATFDMHACPRDSGLGSDNGQLFCEKEPTPKP